MIKPTIGRKVWFQPADGDQGTILGAQPFDATIVYVHDDRNVNLSIRDHAGNQSARHDVPLMQDGDDVPEGGYFACWMPYQVGQAAKTEALQGQLNAGNQEPAETDD